MATTLARGEAAVIAFNTAQSDASGNPPTVEALRFVILRPLDAGAVIYFTDRTWNGTAFVTGANDGVATYTVPAGGLAAGTTILLTGAALGTLNLEELGDTIYVYQGTTADAPTTFLSAIEIGDGNTTFNASLVNTGLTAGVNALAVGLDSASYQGPTTEAYAHLFNGESLIENLSDPVNWEGDNRSPTNVNALDHPDHNGPYLRAGDLSLWIAAVGGGTGIVSVSGDATVNGGSFGYNYNQLSTLDNEDLSPTFFAPRDIVFDTVHGKFFLADSNIGGGTNRILQGNISDLIGNSGNPPPMITIYASNQGTTLASQIFNLHLDENAGIVYFTHGQTLAKVNYDTPNQTAVTLANFGTGSGNPVGSTNNFIDDFVISGSNIYLTSHRVQSAQDGDNVTRNFLYRITGLDAADGAGAFTFGNGAITVLPFSPDDDDVVDGGLDIPGEAFPRERGTIEGVAISADGNTLYFTTASILFDNDGDGGFSGPGGFGTPPQLRMGGIYSYALTGNPTGAYTQIYQQVAGSGPQGILDELELDPVTGHLYFTDISGQQMGAVNPPGDEGVWRIATNGTGLTFFQGVSNINSLGGSSIFLNRAPTVTSSTLTTPGVTEASNAPGSGATSLVQPLTAIDLSDFESADQTDQLSGAVVRISNNFQSGVTHADRLTINGTTSGVLDFGVQDITYSYNAATGVLTLTGASTFNNYEAALVLVRFNTSGDDPTAFGAATTRTISYSVSDGLNHSDEISTTVTVTGINDAPVNAVGATTNTTEDLTAVQISGPGNVVSVSDIDADPATQDIVTTLTIGTGAITILTNVAGGIVAGDITGGANGSATITITATQNQINATLAAANGLTFTPPANYNGATTLTVTTNDLGLNGNDPGLTGTGTSEQDSDVRTINIANVNDAPTVSGDGTESAPAIDEDVPSATGQTVTALFGGQFADTLDQQQTGGNPTGSVANTLAGIAVVANGSSGATGQWQYFNGTIFVDIGAASTASAQLINAGTAIRFNPALNSNGPAPTLTVVLVDSSGAAFANGDDVNLSAVGATGGTTRFSSGTVVLSQVVNAVNDAPQGADGTYTFAEDGSRTLTEADFGYSDPVEGNGFTGVVITTLPTDGVLLLNGVAVTVAGTFVTESQIAASQLVFQSDANENGTPYATFTFQVRDDGGTANSGQDTDQSANTLTFDVSAVDDLPVAVADTATVAENATVAIAVLTNDTDVDGGPKTAVQINGTNATVGVAITLASGATATLNGDGTIGYNPNGQFSSLTDGTSGAANTSAQDSFDYSLNGGSSTTVTVTVNGVAGPGDVLRGSAGNDSVTGTAQADLFVFSQGAGGTDSAAGGGGSDGFYFGATLDPTDSANGEAGGDDQVGIRGTYAITLGATTLLDIETLALFSGGDARFEAAGGPASYDITTVDGNVGAGARLFVNGNGLQANESFTFDGSAETNGSFVFFGGFGVEDLTGGAGNDGFFFGDGRYDVANDKVDGSAGADDQLGLRGNFGQIVFAADALVNIDTIALISSGNLAFGGGSAVDFNYDLVLNDGNAVNGQLIVTGTGLEANETLSVNGSAEDDSVLVLRGGAGNDVLTGGSLGDTLFGGGSGDTLTGGAGNDTFAYRSLTDSDSNQRDGIQDFALGDLIDLSLIDANANADGNQDFDFIGTNAFSGTAGELRYENISLGGPIFLVQGDVNGDGVSDFEVVLVITTPDPITSSDFAL